MTTLPSALRFAVPLLFLSSASFAQESQPQPTPPYHTPYPPSVVAPTPLGSACAQDMQFPPAALAVHASGVATVLFIVTVKGETRDAQIVASTGNRALDEASLECIKQWKFSPATENGKPVEVYKRVKQTWKS